MPFSWTLVVLLPKTVTNLRKSSVDLGANPRTKEMHDMATTITISWCNAAMPVLRRMNTS